MTKLRLASVAVLVCLVCAGLDPVAGLNPVGRNSHCALPCALRAQSQPAVLSILQSELSRNVDVLKQQPVPAYYAAYTLYDSRSTQILASVGAIDRSDENRQRFATVGFAPLGSHCWLSPALREQAVALEIAAAP